MGGPRQAIRTRHWSWCHVPCSTARLAAVRISSGRIPLAPFLLIRKFSKKRTCGLFIVCCFFFFYFFFFLCLFKAGAVLASGTCLTPWPRIWLLLAILPVQPRDLSVLFQHRPLVLISNTRNYQKKLKKNWRFRALERFPRLQSAALNTRHSTSPPE